jgi:hypothetical protein
VQPDATTSVLVLVSRPTALARTAAST